MALSLLFPVCGYSELFPLPPIEEETAFIYRSSPVKKGKYSQAIWGFNLSSGYTIEQHKIERNPEGQKITMIQESIDKKIGSNIVTLEFSVESGRLKQTRFLREVITFAGDRVFHYEIDLKKLGKVFPPDSYSVEIMTFLFKGMYQIPKQTLSYHWLISEKSAVPIYVKMKKPKKINVPAGTYTCFPVEMYIDVADFMSRGKLLNRIINPFLPEVVLYFDINPPHHFVHYKGPLGPPGSAEGRMDLLKVVRGKEAIKEACSKLKSPDFYADRNDFSTILSQK